MDSFDFIIGCIIGIFFYHVFVVRLLNNPKYKRFLRFVRGEGNDKR